MGTFGSAGRQLVGRFRRLGAASGLRETVDDLVNEGSHAQALDLLTGLDASERTGPIEVRMRDLRLRAAAAAPRDLACEQWPPPYEDPFPGLDREIPEVSASQLSTETMGGAVQHHGCLLVRRLFADPEVAATVALIDSAVDRQLRAPDAASYSPVETDRPNDVNLRRRVEANGGAWLADSPRATAIVMDEFRSTGVTDAMTEHFGTRPFFSLQKSTLRRVEPEARMTGWHQDGSFLDEGVRTMNVWVALTRCGGSHPASGLEVVPTRMASILDLELEGRAAVPLETVDQLAAEVPILRPEFEAGDALIFDELLLHRTHLAPGLTERRYALECWFFAPSHVTTAYEPLLV